MKTVYIIDSMADKSLAYEPQIICQVPVDLDEVRGMLADANIVGCLDTLDEDWVAALTATLGVGGPLRKSPRFKGLDWDQMRDGKIILARPNPHSRTYEFCFYLVEAYVGWSKFQWTESPYLRP